MANSLNFSTSHFTSFRSKQDPGPAKCHILFAPGSPLEATLQLAKVAAQSMCPIFLRGESGTGKEKIAQYVHQQSPRASGPFVAINCAALPANLIESELFGHRKGAFTGATSDSPGKFRLADGGTILLDEIGDMPLDIQTRLLRVLQEKTICALGDSRERPVDFRLLCATHRDLKTEVQAGRFREDLFYRLNVLQIHIPPLRARPLDIKVLMKHFLMQTLSEYESNKALENLPNSLLNYSYPGNVRELVNLVERFSIMRQLGWGWDEVIEDIHNPIPEPLNFGNAIKKDREGLPPQELVHSNLLDQKSNFERDNSHPARNSRVTNSEILQALQSCGHHRTKTSNLLGISRRALQYRLSKMNTIS